MAKEWLFLLLNLHSDHFYQTMCRISLLISPLLNFLRIRRIDFIRSEILDYDRFRENSIFFAEWEKNHNFPAWSSIIFLSLFTLSFALWGWPSKIHLFPRRSRHFTVIHRTNAIQRERMSIRHAHKGEVSALVMKSAHWSPVYSWLVVKLMNFIIVSLSKVKFDDKMSICL